MKSLFFFVNRFEGIVVEERFIDRGELYVRNLFYYSVIYINAIAVTAIQQTNKHYL